MITLAAFAGIDAMLQTARGYLRSVAQSFRIRRVRREPYRALVCRRGSCGSADRSVLERSLWNSPLGEDGCDLRDDNNPDVNARNRKIIGLEVLRGLKQADDEGSVWNGGTIYESYNWAHLLLQSSNGKR